MWNIAVYDRGDVASYACAAMVSMTSSESRVRFVAFQ
jgi:hypothetical protein